MPYKITLIREDCIGCGSCAEVCPDYWEMADDGLSDLIESEENDEGDFVRTAEDDRECNEDAADSCPVDVILIEDV